jgi:hypothetical protein
MDFGDFIRLAGREPALRFLIIGGYAVGAHGFVRATFDVDFLVRRAERAAWMDRFLGAGLKLAGETNAFCQFAQEAGDGLDLMFVTDDTFGQLWTASIERDFGPDRARIPSLDHLLALKLHALRQGLAHRTGKDAQDVEMLLRRNKINLRDAHYEQLFLKYGNRELLDTFERIVRTL